MNDSILNSYNEEPKVNLIDMMFYLLRHWRTLFVAFALGALLGIGIYIIKEPNEAEKLNIEFIEEAEGKYDLDADVKESTELAYKYRQLYASQLKYNKNSIIMQMDPNSVYKGSLEYYVSADNDTRLLGEFFQNILKDSNFLKSIKNSGGLDCDLQFVSEILNCSLNQADYQVLNMSGEKKDSSHNLIISYNILYNDPKACERMLEVISDKVEKLNQELQEQYGEYEFIKTNDTLEISVNNDILNKQKTSVDAINNYLNNITRLEGTFSEEDMEYYESVYLSREAEKDEEVSLEVNNKVLESSTRDVFKWGLAGVFLACVCWGVYYIVKYLFNTNIKNSKELSCMYGIQTLGIVEAPATPKKGIDGFLSKLDRKRKGYTDTVEYICATINTLNLKKPLLCFEHELEELQTLSSVFAKQCTNLSIENMLHHDVSALEVAKSSDGIILMVAVGKTDYREIGRELDVCRIQRIPVYGVVVVDKM